MNQPQSQFELQNQPQLTLNGCAYRIAGDRVVVTIGAISNQRDFGDLSGTLSVELWALRQPYQGGFFEGVALAGTQIGEISGQHYISDCCYALNFQEPPAGTWYLALMVREWTDAGFVTRDYVNFAVPYVVTWAPTVIQAEPAKVISVHFAETETTGKTRGAEPKAITKALPKADTKAEIKAETTTAKPSVQASKAPAQPRKAKAPTQAVGAVSINDASVDEIASIKGVSRKVAAKIVESRPFETLEQLLKVRGVGEKLFKRIRSHVTL